MLHSILPFSEAAKFLLSTIYIHISYIRIADIIHKIISCSWWETKTGAGCHKLCHETSVGYNQRVGGRGALKPCISQTLGLLNRNADKHSMHHSGLTNKAVSQYNSLINCFLIRLEEILSGARGGVAYHNSILHPLCNPLSTYFQGNCIYLGFSIRNF